MKSEDRRAAIVQAAIDIFAEKGFRGTTTRELASALNVTEPVLYQHFRTKKELYSAIIAAKACESQQDALAFLTALESTDDRAVFCAIGNLILDRFQKDPKLVRLLLYSALERHELSDMFFDSVVVEFLRMVSAYIKRRIRSGAFRKVNPDVAARALVGMFNYHGLNDMLHPGRLGRHNRNKLVNEIVTLYLSGIAVDPPRG